MDCNTTSLRRNSSLTVRNINAIAHCGCFNDANKVITRRVSDAVCHRNGSDGKIANKAMTRRVSSH